jgi:hypothetical protein
VSDPETIQRIRMKNLSERIMSMGRVFGEMERSDHAATDDACNAFLEVAAEERLPPRSPARLKVHSDSSLSTELSPPKVPRSPYRRQSTSIGNSACSSRATSPVRPPRAFERGPAETGKGNLSLEYSDQGTGDFRIPSFIVNSPNGSSISPLRYRRHRIVAGKPGLPHQMPGIRCTDDNASTLIVTMIDVFSGIEVNLIYTCLHDYDAIIRYVSYYLKILPCITMSVDASSSGTVIAISAELSYLEPPR